MRRAFFCRCVYQIRLHIIGPLRGRQGARSCALVGGLFVQEEATASRVPLPPPEGEERAEVGESARFARLRRWTHSARAEHGEPQRAARWAANSLAEPNDAWLRTLGGAAFSSPQGGGIAQRPGGRVADESSPRCWCAAAAARAASCGFGESDRREAGPPSEKPPPPPPPPTDSSERAEA